MSSFGLMKASGGGGAINITPKQLASPLAKAPLTSLWPMGQCPVLFLHQVPELVCPAPGLPWEGGLDSGWETHARPNCLLGGAAFRRGQEKVCEVENWALGCYTWLGRGGAGKRVWGERKLLHGE